MNFMRCPCGHPLDCYADAFNYYVTNVLQLVVKGAELTPHKLQFYINDVDLTPVFEFLDLQNPCCRTHIKNYYDPIKALYGVD